MGGSLSRRLERAQSADPPGDVTIANGGQAQFGIIQGGVFPDVASRERRATVAIGFEGYAIGGLSVGEPIDVMYGVVERDRGPATGRQPRYLMGAGTPEDLVECVGRGIDMFDCVLPTRNARNGQLFTSLGRINIKNARYAEDDGPARSGLPLLHLHASLARLSAPPPPRWRDERPEPLTRCITWPFTLTR